MRLSTLLGLSLLTYSAKAFTPSAFTKGPPLASVPDYAHEWLTYTHHDPVGKTTCNRNGGYTKKDTALARYPFAEKDVASVEACCAFCQDVATIAQPCGAWTFHENGMCYVSEVANPHYQPGSVSGLGPGSHVSRTPPPARLPKPNLRHAPLPKPKPPLGYQPNFVFILADDQDRILGRDGYDSMGSLAAMTALQERLLGEGAIVENFHVNTPICCPSRTEFFTGRYFHNVKSTTGPSCMYADTTLAGSNKTGLFGLMQRVGYNVGVFGKVTNDQGRILEQLAKEGGSSTYIDSPLDYNDYMGRTYYRAYHNGTTFTEKLPKKDPIYGTAYQTTQIGNRTLRWLDDAIKAHQPFFAYIGPHAPHFPAQPAPWYEHAFDDCTAPITPNYNVSSPDKAQHVAQNPPLNARVKCWEDQHFRDRWSSLRSVDDIIAGVYDKLEAEGVLNKTFVLYSSDHGYKLGQWRIGTSKQHPYETDIRVPFLMRGPGVMAGGNFTAQVSGNVDVLPTMLHLAAGMEFVDAVNPDGRSMASFMVEGVGEAVDTWRDHWLNEYLSLGSYYNDHSAIWEDGSTTKDKCGGMPPRGPAAVGPKTCQERTGVGEGECYFIDSHHSNSWRQLRVKNTTMDWNYVEYDPAWKFNSTDPTGAGLQHYELYNVAVDPYQMKNLYRTTSPATRAALHAQLVEYYQCSGKSCP